MKRYPLLAAVIGAIYFLGGLSAHAQDEVEYSIRVEERFAEALGALYGEAGAEQGRGVKLLKKLAVGGHARSQYMLGVAYQQGIGAAANAGQAFRWFESAAEAGYPMAMLPVAEAMLGAEDEGEKDYGKARSLLERILDPSASNAIAPEEFGPFRATKSRANYLLALIYLNGWGVVKDAAKAIELLTAASLTGDQDASMHLAIAYAKGENVEKDVGKAKEYFELLSLQSADEMNRSIESAFAASSDSSDRSNLIETSQAMGAFVSDMIHAMQTEFAQEVLSATGEDFDAEFAAGLLQLAVEGGYAEAKVWLGWLYYRGLGVEQNLARAAELFVEAVADNWILAQYNVALMIRAGHIKESPDLQERDLLKLAAEQGLFAAQAALDGDDGLEVMNPEEAKQLCVLRAEEGDPRALYSLAVRKTAGWRVEVEPDLQKIADLYQRAAKSGYARAQHRLGMMLMTGHGVESDFQSGLLWLRSAAFQDLPEALYFMGTCYLGGLGVEPDVQEAFRYFARSAEFGYDNAKNRLATFYFHGILVGKDEYRAASLYLEAAGEGDAEAAQNLGNCYLRGLGVRANVAEGIRWIARSAELGNLTACFQLAHIYQEGLLVDPDDVEVAHWQERAAEMGDKGSMKRTAFNYYLGKGVPRNRGKASTWLGAYHAHPAAVDASNLYYPNEYEDYGVVQSILPDDYAALLLSANLLAETGWSGSDPEQAVSIYEKLAAKGSRGAKLRLAKLFLSDGPIGKRAKKGFALMKSLFESSKRGSNPGKQMFSGEAAYWLSRCYAEGIGIRSNAAQRQDWLETAANLGHTDAQYELGVALAAGETGRGDRSQGTRWLLAAARSGDWRSQLHLARMHLETPVEGLGEEVIVDWLKKLEDSGSSAASSLLRRFGIEPDNRERDGRDAEEAEPKDTNPWIPIKAA